MRKNGAIAQQKIYHASHLASDQVTVSLGIATVIPTVETSWKALVTQADVALYQAKKTGARSLFLSRIR